MKKTLCILTDILIYGGVEAVILNALPFLSKQYDVTLFVLTGRLDNKLKEYIPSNVRIETGSFQWNYINELKVQLPFVSSRYFKREIGKSYDILIIVKILCRAAGLANIAPLNIYWNHSEHDAMYENSNQLDFLHKVYRLRLGKIYKSFDEVWQVSNLLKEKYERAFGLKNCYTIPNPIDVNRIISLSKDTSKDCFFSKHILSIIMVGRLSFEKGFDRVICAIGRIQPQIPYQVIIIGEGQEETHLKELTSQYQLNDHIVFLGKKDNPYPYIQASDLVVCPSREESFGLVILEAMLLNKPVIVTRTIGSEFITENGKNGILIENNDSDIEITLDKVFHHSLQIPYSLDEAYKRATQFSLDQFRHKILDRLEILGRK